MVQETSRIAYEQEILPSLRGRQTDVIREFMANQGPDGMTNNELKVRLGWEINQVTPRVNELKHREILLEIQKRPCHVTGRLAIACILNPNPPMTVPKKSTESALPDGGKLF